MRALVYQGPWEMTMAEHPITANADTDAVIDVIATGLCGSDIHGYSGETDRRVAGQVMGHEMVGRVKSGSLFNVGTVVTVNPILSCGTCDFCVDGDTQVCLDSRVIGVDPLLPGSFADQLVVPARNVVDVTGMANVLHGALVEPLAVGFHALMRGEPRRSDRLLIIGGGPIGQAVALASRRLGLSQVIVSEPTPERRALLESLNFATTTPDRLSEAVEIFFAGKATLVVDAVGIAPSLTAAFHNSTTRARIVLVGMGANQMEIAPYNISVQERTVLGSYCYSESHFRETADWVSTGRPELDLLIDRVVPLSDGPQAFHDSASSPGTSKKILLRSTTGECDTETSLPAPRDEQ